MQPDFPTFLRLMHDHYMTDVTQNPMIVFCTSAAIAIVLKHFFQDLALSKLTQAQCDNQTLRTAAKATVRCLYSNSMKEEWNVKFCTNPNHSDMIKV
jgi:hypothetical protein